MNIIEVPLSRLAIAEVNLRKTGTGNVDDLVASIEAHGLLQNLTVVRGTGDHANYLVIAGGRRLRALQQLVKLGKLAAEFPVPCNIVDQEAASEASLTENISREAMHPADEFDAFHKLAQDGVAVGGIAARFGKSERYVQQRLRLANVAPKIMADYRAGDATLEQLMALAITDDQARQLRVWKLARNPWQREPDRLREALVEGEYGVEGGIGKFVGVEAYEKAGGVVRRDLFGKDEDSFLVDTELVQKLALEKLERTAEKIRKEGWAWAEARVEFGYEASSKFATIYPSYKGSREVWSDDQKQYAGAVVTIAHNGQTEIRRGLVRAQDRKAIAQATNGRGQGGNKSADRKPGDLSFAAVQRLQAEAGQIAALAIANNTAIALGILAAELADDAFYQGWDGARTWVHVQREHSGRMPGNIRKEVEKSPAALQLAELEKGWRERLPEKRAELRAWILAQDSPTIRQLLAFLVARETEVVDVSPGSKQGVVDLIAATNVDLASAWKPSVEWLATLPKSTVLAMAKDAGASALQLAELGKLPKAKLAEAALACFKDGWLPKPLRQSAKPAARKPKKAKAAPARAAAKSDTKFPWGIVQDDEARA